MELSTAPRQNALAVEISKIVEYWLVEMLAAGTMLSFQPGENFMNFDGRVSIFRSTVLRIQYCHN